MIVVEFLFKQQLPLQIWFVLLAMLVKFDFHFRHHVKEVTGDPLTISLTIFFEFNFITLTIRLPTEEIGSAIKMIRRRGRALRAYIGAVVVIVWRFSLIVVLSI